MIAIAGPNLPHEVLRAAKCHGGPLPFDPEQPRGQSEQWLESKFAPWAFPVVESWLAGAYDHFDHVLFSRADDTSQRLYYYVCELQRRGLLGGPVPLVFDMAMIPRESSVEHTALQVRSLCDLLGVDDAALESAIADANRSRAAEVAPVTRRTCLLAGTPPPDGRLHRAIESAGFAACGPTLGEEWMMPTLPIDESSADPATALARALHANPRGPRSFARSAEVISTDMMRSKAAAVVLWRIEEDEAQTWHLPAERRMLEASGVPHLVLTRRDWLARDGAGDEIAAFLQGVGA